MNASASYCAVPIQPNYANALDHHSHNANTDDGDDEGNSDGGGGDVPGVLARYERKDAADEAN